MPFRHLYFQNAAVQQPLLIAFQPIAKEKTTPKKQLSTLTQPERE